MANNRENCDLNHDFPHFEQLSRLLPGDERIRENIFVDSPISQPPCGSVFTVYDVLKKGSILSENGPCLGQIVEKKYVWMTYDEVIEEAEVLGKAMLAHGEKAGDRVGIAGIHSVRYIIAMHGMSANSLAIVPLYHNNKISVNCDIATNCKLTLIFCDTVGTTSALAEQKKLGTLPNVQTLVVLEDKKFEGSEVAGLKIMSYEQFRELGMNSSEEPTRPSPEDVYVICHTSGTTGRPKGVQMTHKNVLAAMAGLFTQWTMKPNFFHFDHSDVYFSFLSLAHVYEHLMESFALYIGGRIGVYGRDITALLSDIQALQPTIISLVPRLLNKFYDRIHSEFAKKGFIAQQLFNFAKYQKLRYLHNGIQRYDTIWDKLVFDRLRPLFGGKLRMITTGGAPVTDAVKEFTRIAYGCPLMEGYGQTECAAAGTLNLPFEYKSGVVGAPAPWAQVKLVDVPEMSYFAKDDKGEICFRGAAVMKGYFGDPELTAKTVDDEGWLHTGDIGLWTSNGGLAVIDRKNALFKLAQGDFVSPEQIEASYLNCNLLSQLFVVGRTTRSFLVGICVPNMANLRTALRSSAQLSRFASSSDQEILSSCEVRDFLLSQMNLVGKESGLQTIEIIKHLRLVGEEWTAENNFVTPTLKLKRHLLREHCKYFIDEMYSEDNCI